MLLKRQNLFSKVSHDTSLFVNSIRDNRYSRLRWVLISHSKVQCVRRVKSYLASLNGRKRANIMSHVDYKEKLIQASQSIKVHVRGNVEDESEIKISTLNIMSVSEVYFLKRIDKRSDWNGAKGIFQR